MTYRKKAGYAVHHRPMGAPAPGAAFLLNDGEIAVYPGDPSPAEMEVASAVPWGLTAVYAQEPSGAPAIPTGLVMVRYSHGISVQNRLPALHQAGYEIVESLPYAPNAAWLRARSGSPAESLVRLSELEQLPELDNVEPQMLLGRHYRL